MTWRGGLGLVLGGAVATPQALSSQSAVVVDSLWSPALAPNVVGDSPLRRVLVYLPPSYNSHPERRYPTLYLLHGATSLPIEWLDGSYQGFTLQVAMDSLLVAAVIPEFLVIMPDANNALGASFYANSPATGGWEDFVVRDLVRHIDRNYRTDGRASRRALAGHSMGGFGALTIGFQHPDVFGFIDAISPCCIGLVGRLDSSNPAWRALPGLARWQDAPSLVLGLAAALSGSPTSPRLFEELPFAPGPGGTILPDPVVQARWLARMPPDLASAMVRRGGARPLVYFEAGSEETGILAGIRILRGRLDSLGVRYVDTTFVGGHIDRVRSRITEHLLPTAGRWFAAAPR